MAVIDITSSTNLNTVTYAQDDVINVLDGVTLTINSQWSIKPRTIQALGTGRIEVSNTSTTTPHLQEFYLQQATNAAGFTVQQNGVLQTRGNWITVGTSNGNNNQVLFSANNVGGVSIDYPTMIQVETGNGTDEWEIWNAIPEDVTGGLVNSQGFNTPNITVGTVAVGAGGVVTGIGTNFLSNQVGLPFKLPGIARDFVIATHTSATSILLQELDGTTYTGGVVVAGSTYILRAGSLINPAQAGSSEVGKVLFFNPLTTAVRMGNDINGTKIPTGARVRIPNIHFNSAIQQTTLATAITGTGAQAFTLAAQIGSTAPGTYNAAGLVGTFLLVNGSTVERIFYSSRTGAVVSATGMVRGAYGTTAQASFPIGTTVYWIPANSATNNASIGASPSGTVDMQICSLGLRMTVNFSAFASLTIYDFGFSYLFNCGNTAGGYDINSLSGLGIGYANPNVNGGITAQFSALLGVGNIRNVSVTNNLPGGANSYSNIAVGNVQGLIFMSNLRSRHWGRTTNAGGGALGVSFQTIKCATPVNGVYSAGSSVRFATIDNVDAKEIYISSLPNANSLGTGDTFVPIFVTGVTDSTIRGYQLWGGGLSTRASLISVDSGSSDVVFHNKTYPDFNGGLQLSSIISDLGLNTIVAHISISNPRITTSSSVLPNTMAFNRGGVHRMLLIDSITSTATGSGAQSKGGLGLDVIAGPHRFFQTVAANSIIPNLADVQPIVVMSNLAKTVGSVYVGSFSSQSSFDMYTFTGGTYLDNLGRIYYPSIGDSVIIKSVFPLRGITNFTGTAFDFNYNLSPGSNTVPAGTTFEFRMTNWGTANTGAWLPFTNNASLETARAALTGYNSSVGINLQFRVTGTTAVAGRYLMSVKLPVTIDSTYNPPVSETQVGINGAQTNTLLAGYLNADPNNPVLQGSLITAGSFGSIPMPYDYDGTPVDYRLIGRLQGWTFVDVTGIYDKNDVSVPITQTQVVDLSNNPLYTSGVTGVAVNYGASTITLSSSRSSVQVWSAVQDSLCLLENLTQNNPFSTTNGSSFVSDYTLVVTGTLTSGNVIGNVTLSGALSSGVSITGNVSQALPTNLTGVTINGNLTYNTNTPITITLTNSSISGTVSNSGTGLVTINRANSTIGTVGSNISSKLVTSLNINGITAGSQIYVANQSGTQVEYVASSGTSYSLNTTGGTGSWTYKVAKYGFITQEGNFTPETSSTTITVTLLVDTYVVDILANVIAYTNLNSTQKITDYASYYGTTNAGIIIGSVLSKGFGTLTVPAGLTLNPTAVALFAVSSGVVTTKSSGLDESVTIISSGNFTQGSATLSNDVIIRASNLDSEVIYNADSITFYPTLTDRNAGSNPGVTTTGGIYRFKYASTYSGVTMIGTLYIRIQEGLTTISPPGVNIIIGSNTIDTSVQGQLSSIKSDISLIPQDTWEYENRTLNNALFE